nr:ABC transporter permease [uncultured Clostridium sp.]
MNKLKKYILTAISYLAIVLIFHYISGPEFWAQLGKWYWVGSIALWCLVSIYFLWALLRESQGKLTWGRLLVIIWKKYRFLMEQLISRDFKVKYKRSVLGYLWSFLNPLLTMLVQYIVFSTIFNNGVDNYPVYLLSGAIMFSFFSEAVGQGLTAIVYNASLITKVYVPKYIYPVTKVMSSSINLLISIVPLLLVTLLTGQKLTKAVFLLPYPVICLVVFCIGLSLILCSSMVFFRDTQYLWGIVNMAWMYATPMFYPESIIPPKYRLVLWLNPMRHIIKFVRTVLIDGVSPGPISYLCCFLSAVLTCIFGIIVFKKTQNKFVIHI